MFITVCVCVCRGLLWRMFISDDVIIRDISLCTNGMSQDASFLFLVVLI